MDKLNKKIVVDFKFWLLDKRSYQISKHHYLLNIYNPIPHFQTFK